MEIPALNGVWFTGNVAFPVIPDQEFPRTHLVGWLVFMAVGVTDAGTASRTRERRMSEGAWSFPNVATPTEVACGGVVLPFKSVICVIPVRV